MPEMPGGITELHPAYDIKVLHWKGYRQRDAYLLLVYFICMNIFASEGMKSYIREKLLGE
jgi:hypothetical protein